MHSFSGSLFSCQENINRVTGLAYSQCLVDLFHVSNRFEELAGPILSRIEICWVASFQENDTEYKSFWRTCHQTTANRSV